MENDDALKLRLSATGSEAEALRNSTGFLNKTIDDQGKIIEDQKGVIQEWSIKYDASQGSLDATTKSLNLKTLELYIGIPLVAAATYFLISLLKK